MAVKKADSATPETPPEPETETKPKAAETPDAPAKDDSVSEKLDTLIDLIKGIIPGKKEEEAQAVPDITAHATELEVEVPPPTAPAKFKRYGIIKSTRKAE